MAGIQQSPPSDAPAFCSRPRRNSRWKLDAIDFFNEELMRFLSFNNAILASIEDVIIVCDPEGRVVYQNPAAKSLGEYRENPGRAAEYLSSLLDGREFKLEPAILHFCSGAGRQDLLQCDGYADFYGRRGFQPARRDGAV